MWLIKDYYCLIIYIYNNYYEYKVTKDYLWFM